MIEFPEIDPIALSIGPLSIADWEIGPLNIHWYGITYLVGFAGAWLLAKYRAKKFGGWTEEQVADLIFYGALGVVLGGRFGYVLFYNFDQFLANPMWLFHVWEGGMSFHGGLIGVLVAFYLFGRKVNKGFFEVSDFLAPMVPIGLGAGRIGNFIGGELWGRTTDVPWAMVFPRAGDFARHPSQLYQFALEGVILFALLFWFSSRSRPEKAVSGLFLIGYGSFRFLVEFFRQPDAHLGFIAFNWLSMGQLLSLPMIIVGAFFMHLAYQKKAA